MKWKQCIRKSGLLEWVCEHTCGHPDLNSVRELSKITGQETWAIHGCDGCCEREDFPGKEKK